MEFQVQCEACRGEGRLSNGDFSTECSECGGSGLIVVQKSRDDVIQEILAKPEADRAMAYWRFARAEFISLGGDANRWDEIVPRPT